MVGAMPKHQDCDHLVCRWRDFVAFLRADPPALVAVLVGAVSLVIFVASHC
jgi:hypothetical protein